MRWLLPLTLLFISCGSNTQPSPPTSTRAGSLANVMAAMIPWNPIEVPPCTEPPPSDDLCPPAGCGANSESINNFPSNGVRSDGECNNEGVQLLPGSMAGGVANRCQGATLAIRDNQFIGLNALDGSPQCAAEDLRGASFVLRSWVKKDGKYRTLRVNISEINGSYRADERYRSRMAYRLMDDAGQSLCSATSSARARVALGLGALSGLTDPRDGRDMVIPVRSELYDNLGRAIKISQTWRLREPEWLQLACVDDALAKRSLYNLYSDDVFMSRAALAMLTANYCGGLHATSRGAKIGWEIYDEGVTSSLASGTLHEAKWAPEGALCMDQPRILYQEGPSPQVPQSPSGKLKSMIGSCVDCTPATVSNLLRACTFAEKHWDIPTCSHCESDSCKGVSLHSYVVPKEAGR